MPKVDLSELNSSLINSKSALIEVYEKGEQESIVWDEVDIPISELLDLYYDDASNWICHDLLENSPNYLLNKVENLSDLTLALKFYTDVRPKSELIKNKIDLINSASIDELINLVKEDNSTLGALIGNLDKEKLLHFRDRYIANNKERTLSFLFELGAQKNALILQEHLASLLTTELINNIKTFNELHKVLTIKNLPDDKLKEIIQAKIELINSASSFDIIHFIKDNKTIPLALAKNLSHEQLIAVIDKFSGGAKEKVIDFLRVVQQCFTEEQLIEFGKKYISGNKENALIFFEAVESRNNSLLTSALTDSFPPEVKESILKKHPYRLAKEVGLILGLNDTEYNGSTLKVAMEMTKQRFERLTSHLDTPLVLDFQLRTDYEEASSFYEPKKQPLEHGELRSIHNQWKEHAFTFHLIKDKEKTHLIYVNRGQRHSDADDAAVSVFTFTKQEDVQRVIPALFKCLNSENRQRISRFIVNDLMPFNTETDLNEALQKSDQKTGNCTIANANIAWHFALAAQEMKQTGCAFIDAYKKTKVAYKEMRKEDRAAAFCELVTNPELESYRKDGLVLLMEKMTVKNNGELIPFLLKRLHEKDPLAVVALLHDLTNNTYDFSNPEKQKNWINACTNTLVLNVKDELTRIIIKGANATESKEKQQAASYFLRQLAELSEPTSLKELTQIMYQAERVFSHVRNPFIGRTLGASKTDSYKATKDDFASLRSKVKSLNSGIELIDSVSIIQSKAMCKTYKQILNEMNLNKQNKQEEEQEVKSNSVGVFKA